jgi:hypothetical protein
MQPPVLSLHGLPKQLLELVLRFVPPRDKLLQLTHLSSSAFPALAPAHFSEDSLELNVRAVQALHRSASLHSLLSRVSQFSVCTEPWPRLDPGPESDAQSMLRLSLHSFSTLQTLHLWWTDGFVGRSLYPRDILA